MTKIIKGLVICFVLFGISLALEEWEDQPSTKAACSGHTQCSTCAASKGCGWCTATEQCLPGTATGPINSTCIGTSWQYKGCRQCNQLMDCRSCKDFQSDCFWCSDTKTCNALGSPCSTGWTETCPCDVYQTCSSCQDDATCMWCGSSMSCMKTTDNCVMPAHTCPCTSNTDCFSCKTDYKCNWCDVTSSCMAIGNSTSGCAFSHTCNGFCSQYTSCDDCQTQNGCAWCGKLNTCVQAETATCLIAHTCPDCVAHRLCGPCSDTGVCIWCSSTQLCMPVGTDCTIADSCEAYCNAASSCQMCAKQVGCGWCADTASCEDMEVTGCLITHTCGAPIYPSSCGFDGGAFVGGMFLVIGVVGLLIGIYVFYRWKTGRHISYSELK